MIGWSNGALAPVPGSPFPGSGFGTPFNGLAGVEINCASTLLFGGQNFLELESVVDVFTIGPSGVLERTGDFRTFPGQAFNSNVVLLSPDDRFLFVSNQESGTVTASRVGPGGALTDVAIASVTRNASGMATDQTGSFLYVALPFASLPFNTINAVAGFRIGSGGSLTPVPGSPVATNQQGRLLSLTVFPAKACREPAITVAIDVRPGSSRNHINPRSRGVIPVAILTTSSFDATTVDPLSVKFGPDGAAEAHGRSHIRDVDGDGHPDLLLHFRVEHTGIDCGDTSVSLTGETRDGQSIQGTAPIHTVGGVEK